MLRTSARFVLSALGLAAAMSVGGLSQAGQAGKTLTAGLTPVSGKNDDISLMTTGGAVLATSTSGTSLIDTVVRTNTSASSVAGMVRVVNISAAAGSYTLHLAY